MKVAVIGAGPAGLTSAYQLTKESIEVDVYEGAPAVGGLSRTLELWGQKVDLGPHRFFTTDPDVNEIWAELIQNDFSRVDRLTRILYKNNFFFYPLKPANALLNLGVLEALRCTGSYGVQKFDRGGPEDTFEQFVVKRFGRRLFEIFFKSYSEKLWGIGCDELDASFAVQRIKKLSFYEAFKDAFLNSGKSKHKTLVDAFNYPHGGTGMLYDRMAKAIREAGSRVYLNTLVKGVIVKDGEATGVRLADGSVRNYDHVISSMPLSHLVLGLPDTPPDVVNAAKSLEYRNTTLVYLKVDHDDLFPDNWIYIHSPELQVGRVCNFRNWVPQLYGDKKESILCMEYWSYHSDPLWNESDENLIALASREIQSTGLTKDAPILEGHVVRLARSYPVYRKGYKAILQLIVDYLNSIENFTAIGRTGAFKYNNQDHSILMGILAAKNVLEGSNTHDLWEINTDYEYQESKPLHQLHAPTLQPSTNPI